MANAVKVQVSGSHDANAATRPCRYVCAAASAPPELWPEFIFTRAGAALSAATELR